MDQNAHNKDFFVFKPLIEAFNVFCVKISKISR